MFVKGRTAIEGLLGRESVDFADGKCWTVSMR
jgi:hypothetical protein